MTAQTETPAFIQGLEALKRVHDVSRTWLDDPLELMLLELARRSLGTPTASFDDLYTRVIYLGYRLSPKYRDTISAIGGCRTVRTAIGVLEWRLWGSEFQ